MISDILWSLVVVVVAYLIGSIPFGLIVVKLLSGKNLLHFASGRTGGTNAFRAAGLPAGIMTALLDVLKGFLAVVVAKWLHDSAWVHILAPIFSILGHNYSIFLVERNEEGKITFRGGAGGAPCLGGAIGLWPPSALVIAPLGFAIWYGIGYASVTTMSLALIATILFAIRAVLGLSPWAYVVYGIAAELILVWSLRPNLERLRNGTERLIGWRAKRKGLATQLPDLK
jgi:glycerol-3-phosphate acyltransferase PlsY